MKLDLWTSFSSVKVSKTRPFYWALWALKLAKWANIFVLYICQVERWICQWGALKSILLKVSVDQVSLVIPFVLFITVWIWWDGQLTVVNQICNINLLMQLAGIEWCWRGCFKANLLNPDICFYFTAMS